MTQQHNSGPGPVGARSRAPASVNAFEVKT